MDRGRLRQGGSVLRAARRVADVPLLAQAHQARRGSSVYTTACRLSPRIQGPYPLLERLPLVLKRRDDVSEDRNTAAHGAKRIHIEWNRHQIGYREAILRDDKSMSLLGHLVQQFQALRLQLLGRNCGLHRKSSLTLVIS